MNKLLQMEWYKLRKTNILPLLLIIPLFTFIAGYAPPLFEGSSNEWYITLTYMSLSYSLLFCLHIHNFREKSKKMCYTEGIDLDTCEEDFYVKA